ncbi:MAG: hypothetical protein Q9M50_07845 [Methylococcales bacterium]|nr:hypothetical protein [Methylococcales bacterium]
MTLLAIAYFGVRLSMHIYPYPSYKRKDIIGKVVYQLELFLIIIISLFLENFIYLGLVIMLWLLFIRDEIAGYRKRKKGWLAKLDDEFLYFYNFKNKIPINTIHRIERQIIRGEKIGINLVFKNAHVQSEQFSILNNEQHDELVAFLNRSIT